MSKDKESKRIDKYKEQITRRPKFLKILRKNCLVGLVVAVVLCVAVTVFLNVYYKLLYKNIMNQYKECCCKNIERKIQRFEEFDNENKDKDKLYNEIVSDLERAAYSDGQQNNLFMEIGNRLNDYTCALSCALWRRDLIEEQGICRGYRSITVKDNTADFYIGNEHEFISYAIWDDEEQEKTSYLKRENKDGTEGMYSIYTYKPSSEVIAKLIEWYGKIKESNIRYSDNSMPGKKYGIGCFVVDGGVFTIEMSDEKYVKESSFVPCKFTLSFGEFDDNDVFIVKNSESIDIVTDEKEYADWTYVNTKDQGLELYGTNLEWLVTDLYYLDLNKNNDSEYVVKGTVTAADGHEYEVTIVGDLVMFSGCSKSNIIIFFSILYMIIILKITVIAFVISVVVYRKRKALHEIDSYKRTICNAMAHDIKSPLMAVSGYAENIAEDISENDKTAYASKIIETVDVMNESMENMETLAKSEESILHNDIFSKSISDAVEKKKKVKIEDKIAEYLELNKEQIAGRKLTFKVEGQCVVKCEETWMVHLIDNLLGNAIKHSVEGGQIDIILSNRTFVIANDYEGTIDVTGKQLKEAFIKGDNSRHTDGNGVGLSIVDNVVKRHGWKMNIETKDGRFVVKIKM